MLRKDLLRKDFKLFIFGCLLILITSCRQRSQKKNEFTINAPAAPEVNSKYGWLNTDRPYSTKRSQG